MSRFASMNRTILKRLGTAAVRHARPKVPSRQLRSAIRFVPVSDVFGYVEIPHYWAVYVHDGRRPFSAPPGKYLVWFRDPADDPRLSGGRTPERAKDLRHLSRSEFHFWLARNREAFAAGEPTPMIVTRHIRRATKSTPFFGNDPGEGMYSFLGIANDLANPIAQREITRMIGVGGLLRVRDTATGRI